MPAGCGGRMEAGPEEHIHQVLFGHDRGIGGQQRRVPACYPRSERYASGCVLGVSQKGM
jgi:hypothetical protein